MKINCHHSHSWSAFDSINPFGKELHISFHRSSPYNGSEVYEVECNDSVIDDETAKELAQMLIENFKGKETWVSLNLTDHLIGDKGVLALINAFQDIHLLEVDLSHNQIGSEGATALKAFQSKNPHIEIDLSENPFEEESDKEPAPIAKFIEAFELHEFLQTVDFIEGTFGPFGSRSISPTCG